MGCDAWLLPGIRRAPQPHYKAMLNESVYQIVFGLPAHFKTRRSASSARSGRDFSFQALIKSILRPRPVHFNGCARQTGHSLPQRLT